MRVNIWKNSLSIWKFLQSSQKLFALDFEKKVCDVIRISKNLVDSIISTLYGKADVSA